MPKDPPLVRQWLLVRLLCGRRFGLTVEEMAAETGVNTRTIRRDLNVFSQAGFPLSQTTGDRGLRRWRIEPGANQPELSFTFDEAVALYLG